MLTLHDLYGTPFKLEVEGYVDEYILCSPPTVKFYETLLTTYAIELEETITPPDLEDALALVKLLSRTMQMMHVSMLLVDPEVTYQFIETLCKLDDHLPAKYLKEFNKYLPNGEKAEEQKAKVKSKKSLAQTKRVWIPK